MDGVLDLDAVGQAELIRSGQVSPLEMVDAAIDRISALNPTLNAVIHEQFDSARAACVAGLPDGATRAISAVARPTLNAQRGVPRLSVARSG